jgi:hypothetical protein
MVVCERVHVIALLETIIWATITAGIAHIAEHLALRTGSLAYERSLLLALDAAADLQRADACHPLDPLLEIVDSSLLADRNRLYSYHFHPSQVANIWVGFPPLRCKWDSTTRRQTCFENVHVDTDRKSDARILEF